MSQKPKIKVIKKGEGKVVPEPKKAVPVPKQEQVREIVANVTNWVSDFQQRKSEEAKVAIEKFFNQPQTSGA
jgi:hypothetical protein